ncbi:transposase family protein [Noviherbaspirillum sedimenti]|uniref:Transposase family protein n=1 Tax=Noviherbaspirillum sedimenti TaxID=2320865 RepID=A0A3A3G098_9BURK|nr:transposase family protein [Noviherbaspirillum sedimenti]
MNPGMILVQRLRGIDDPRVTGRFDHALADILVIALCAIMAGAEGWDDIEALPTLRHSTRGMAVSRRGTVWRCPCPAYIPEIKRWPGIKRSVCRLEEPRIRFGSCGQISNPPSSYPSLTPFLQQ